MSMSSFLESRVRELETDARRFRALRRMSQVRDKELQNRLDKALPEFSACPNNPTVEEFNAYFDKFVAVLNEVLGAE